ncbi:MAG: hypothetical protein ABS76_18490 [Pelagibacterium sp. SCN 64-44]|nr:MAG: hypothetical protein ABS76_18490 [Pelagibacterium sp. SCN 64-44]
MILLPFVLLLAGAPALAQSAGLAVPPEDGANGCWRRVYDAAHLKAHPDQQVTSMALAMIYRQQPDDLSYYAYALDVGLRDGRTGTATSNCNADGELLRCWVECDGGGVEVSSRAHGDILVDLEAIGFIHLTGGCSAEDEAEEDFALLPGLDDKQFLLHPEKGAFCEKLMPDW